MKSKIFEGVATALVTPFNQNGDVDLNCLQNMIEFQIKNGISAIVIAGTTGEGNALHFEEYSRLIAKSNEFINHRVPLIVGSGSNNTSKAIKLSLEAEKRGANALLIVSPYYNRPTQEGILKHYKAINDHCRLPIIVYNIPARTGVEIEQTTYAKLEEFEHIYGLKQAESNINKSIELLCAASKTPIYCGNDNQFIPFLSLGASGIISVLSNIIPNEMQQMYQDFKHGNNQKLKAKQNSLLKLYRAIFAETNPAPIKKALEMMGFPVGSPRLPLLQCSTETENHLRKALLEHGLI